jgi:hypothetical protein
VLSHMRFNYVPAPPCTSWAASSLPNTGTTSPADRHQPHGKRAAPHGPLGIQPCVSPDADRGQRDGPFWGLADGTGPPGRRALRTINHLRPLPVGGTRDTAAAAGQHSSFFPKWWMQPACLILVGGHVLMDCFSNLRWGRLQLRNLTALFHAIWPRPTHKPCRVCKTEPLPAQVEQHTLLLRACTSSLQCSRGCLGWICREHVYIVGTWDPDGFAGS